MKYILLVMILILMIPNLTFAQVNRVKLDVNNDVNKQIPALIPQEKTNKKISAIGKFLILSTSSVVGGIIGAVIAVSIVSYLGLIVYRTPGLVKIIVDTGLDLVNTGKARVEEFNKIADSVKK